MVKSIAHSIVRTGQSDIKNLCLDCLMSMIGVHKKGTSALMKQEPQAILALSLIDRLYAPSFLGQSRRSAIADVLIVVLCDPDILHDDVWHLSLLLKMISNKDTGYLLVSLAITTAVGSN